MLRVDLKRFRNAIDGMELQRQREYRLLLELRAGTAALLRETEQVEQMEEQRARLSQALEALEALCAQHTQLLRTARLAERQYTWTTQRVDRRCERSAVARTGVTELTTISLKQLRSRMTGIRFMEEEHHGDRSNCDTD